MDIVYLSKKAVLFLLNSAWSTGSAGSEETPLLSEDDVPENSISNFNKLCNVTFELLLIPHMGMFKCIK